MPEDPIPRARPHPLHDQRARPRRRRASTRYCELDVTSNFSFLRGASHPDELVDRASALGHEAIALTDRHSLAGIVRAHVAAKQANMRLIVGARLDLRYGDGAETAGGALPVLVYPSDRASYGRLCRLLTLGKRRAPKGGCDLCLHDLIEHEQGLLVLAIPAGIPDAHGVQALRGLRDVLGDRLWLAGRMLLDHDGEDRLRRVADLAAHLGVPMAATNAVRMHVRERLRLLDVVSCIRAGCTLDEGGSRLASNGDRCLKPPEEMARLFSSYPRAIDETIEIADRARFSLDELRYEYPDEIAPDGTAPMHRLRELTRAGARERYPAGVPARVRTQIEHELRLIDELGYAKYFLTVHEIVAFARSRGILCQGRGAAANSAVCYCLGITSVDPDRISLLFERFISRERDEPPDIDIDFEHERREEVIQHIYERYGRDRAALVCEVISYRGRSAIREVGKALGLSLDLVDRMAKSGDWWDTQVREDRLRAIGLNPEDRTIRLAIELAGEIQGFPRHLSQHVGGFVITRGPLCELVPIENAQMPDRTVIEWDKDDIDAMGMLKVDCLGLGMLTCIRKALGYIEDHAPGHAPLELHSIPPEDPAVYDMICRADTLGVFQIESRAQMAMSPRLRPRCYYDLVIEVAIVRPGPIQGKMVHPYLRRRGGEEPVTYPHPDVERVLGRTLGVPLFQEQAMAMAMVCAGFSAGEADQLRRAMAAWKRRGNDIMRFEQRLIDGMRRRGYPLAFARRCFEQIKGFSGYGFPESHAASFAHLVYASAWIKRYHPAAFCAALLNSQPMGFYAPAQIVQDARRHGVEVRPVDVNFSDWDCTLEDGADTPEHEAPESRRDAPPATWGLGGPAVRLGMRLLAGLREDEARRIVRARDEGPFASVASLRQRTGVRLDTMRTLARADAMASLGLARSRALWEVHALENRDLPLFAQSEPDEPAPALPEPAPAVEVVRDYERSGLSLRAHPVSFLRARLQARGAICAADLASEEDYPDGRVVLVAGLAITRQRPSTASGIVFITIEDESGSANLVVMPDVYERYRAQARHASILMARGVVERQGIVVHIRVQRLWSLDERVPDLLVRSRNFR